MEGLILDTSSNRPFLLLAADGKPLAYMSLESGAKLSKELGANIKEFLRSQPHPSFIAVGTGPGSYTGTRVGVAIAKAMAFGWRIPLFGFPSLQAFTPEARILSHPEWSNRGNFKQLSSPFAILVDAKMAGLYCQKGRLHDEQEGSWEFSPPQLLPPSKVENELSGFSLFSPDSSAILKRALLFQGITEVEPNTHYLADLCCREAPKLEISSSLAPFPLAYLDGKT